jgi:hypothetical protein
MSLTSTTLRALLVDMPAFRRLAFGLPERAVDSDGDGGEVVVWSARVRHVDTNQTGWWCAEEGTEGALLGSEVTWG